MPNENKIRIVWEDLLFAAMYRGDKLPGNEIPELSERQKERLLELLAKLSQREEPEEASSRI